MTREEFKTLVKGMKAVYAQPTFIPDQDAFNVWFELLKDIPYQQANVATFYAIGTLQQLKDLQEYMKEHNIQFGKAGK